MSEQPFPLLEPTAEFNDPKNVFMLDEYGEEVSNKDKARYLISNDILGRGAFGTVHKAWDTKLGPKAAKVISSYFSPRRTEQGLAVEPDTRATLREEAQMLSHLAPHPNVLRVEAYLETTAFNESYQADQLWGIMITERKDEKSTLRYRIKDKSIPIEKTPLIINQIAIGVEYEYKTQVVNRDLKPDNIFVTIDVNSLGEPEYWVQVADFGNGFYDERPDRDLLHPKGKHTGTPQYFSPERAVKDNLALEEYRQSDVYTLGLITYEMLTHERMFAGDSAFEILNEIIRTENPLTDLNPESQVRKEKLEKALSFLDKEKRSKIILALAKSLENDPVKRYEGPLEMAKTLEDAFAYR